MRVKGEWPAPFEAHETSDYDIVCCAVAQPPLGLHVDRTCAMRGRVQTDGAKRDGSSGQLSARTVSPS